MNYKFTIFPIHKQVLRWNLRFAQPLFQFVLFCGAIYVSMHIVMLKNGCKGHVGFPREGSENLIIVSSGPHVVFLTSDL